MLVCLNYNNWTQSECNEQNNKPRSMTFCAALVIVDAVVS